MADVPRPILDNIPKEELILLCQKCLKEQPIKILDSEYNPIIGDYVANIECKVCNFLVTRLVHNPPHGWYMDHVFGRQRTDASIVRR